MTSNDEKKMGDLTCWRRFTKLALITLVCLQLFLGASVTPQGFPESTPKASRTSGSAHLETKTRRAVKVKHQVPNTTTNLRSPHVVDDDVPGEKDETVLEEIIHMPPKSYHLKLPRAGSEGGESSAMIDSIVCACAKCGSTSFYMSLYKIAFGGGWPYLLRPTLGPEADIPSVEGGGR